MDCISPVIEILTCISTFIGIVTCLWPCCVTQANYLCKLQENRDSLEKTLDELKNRKDDVQKKVDDAEANPNEPMKRNDQVNGWLQSVTAIEGEVLEILRQVDQQTSRRCLGGCCPNCCSNYMLGRSIVHYIESLDELRKKGDFEEVAYKLPPPSVQEELVDSTVGMESMFDKVWRLLAEDKVKVMGLYGFGGFGKSTLLKQINNEFLKTTTTTTTASSSSGLNGFDVVILVVVSKVINIDAIQKVIGDRLGLSSPNKTSIFNALSKKNFVLLLDDIWERVDLQSIGIPPSPENKKSKVIFTTRSEIVCVHMNAHIFKVECLPWDKAWALFQEKVGNETLNSHPDVLQHAKTVAKECDGLPLALITIGRAMSTKKTVREWNHAITTLQRAVSEFPGMGKDVFPLLKVSYDSLGNETIKSCFLYCALFPEDESIWIEELVDYWIGEGFIALSEFDHIDEARNYGYDVIGDLKGACLLESGQHGEIEVKMHDTIRDMALWITRECGSSKRDKLLIINAFDGTSERLWYNAERICLMSSSRYTEEEVPTLKSPNLLTLIYTWRWSFKTFPVPQNFFEYMPNLRVLDLTNSTSLRTFPTSITGLLELRYLNLSNTRFDELPEELGKLVKLNYLKLPNMMHLQRIPIGVIGSLLELRVLNLFRSVEVVDWDLDEVYKLKHLNDLGITIKTQHNLNTLLYKNHLQLCTTRLLLLGFQANMVMGIKQQQHLGSFCFQNLIEIIIWNCNGFKDLTWVGYVPKLMKLSLEYCQELEEIVVIVDDFGGGGSTGGGGGDEISLKKRVDIFKSLKTLDLFQLPKLKSICSTHAALAFPCLESMVVEKCPQLKTLLLRQLQFPEEANMGIEQQQHYLGSSCFQNLIQIEIKSCNGFKDLTWVGYVPKLKKLQVHLCDELEEIVVVDDDFGGGGDDETRLTRKVDIFKSLIDLNLRKLPKLKSICRNALAFPCLESLKVGRCPQLKKLPLDSGSNVNNTLKEIQGDEEWWSELQWEEEEEDHDNNNNNNKLLKSKFLPYFVEEDD